MKRSLTILRRARLSGALVAGAIYIVAAASSADAHHSHPLIYDGCKALTIEGTVEKVEYKDPHSLIFFRLDNGTLWTVDWNPLGGLRNSGRLDPAQKALVFGARIAVTGAPIRTLAEIRQSFPDHNTEPNPNTIDPALMRRVDNSWTWTVNSLPGPDTGLCKVFIARTGSATAKQ
jgi:hypothetical protein